MHVAAVFWGGYAWSDAKELDEAAFALKPGELSSIETAWVTKSFSC